jgi:hypothetical protein
MAKTTAKSGNAKGKTAPRAKAKAAAKKAKALVPKIAQVKAANAEPPSKAVSAKAHTRVAALKSAKQPVGMKPGAKAELDTAAAKSRDHALTGRSQLNFRG